MLKLAKLLHSKGFHITFVNCERIRHRIFNSRGPDALRSLDGFDLRTIPDGLPLDAPDGPAVYSSTQKNCASLFHSLISNLNANPTPETPPVTYIIVDGIMTCTLQVAYELQIPVAVFWPTSACSFMGFLHYKQLVERGLVPLKDESGLSNGYLETQVDWIPGMKNIRLKDLPSFIRTTDPDDIMLYFASIESQRASKAPAVILSTFDELELNVLNELRSMIPHLYTIGPLQSPVAFIDLSMWKEEASCLEWLEARAPASVVYVNFGTVTVLTNQKLIEFAWGLANSKQSFLWVIRPGTVAAEGSMVLPQDFLDETKKGGLIMSWRPQEQVLSHPSVGCSLTHNGWNSTLESISCGVPMICWPFFADQQTNCHYACAEWGIGVEIDNDVKRGEVEGLIRELMGGEKRALQWKNSAVAATAEGGSSHVNFGKLVNEVLLSEFGV